MHFWRSSRAELAGGTFGVGQVVHQDDGLALLQVVGHDGHELLLSGGVPNSKSDRRVVDIDDAFVELHCDCGRNGAWQRVSSEVGVKKVCFS